MGEDNARAVPGVCQKRFQPGEYSRKEMKLALGDNELDGWMCHCDNDE